jgi:hypothetical protein
MAFPMQVGLFETKDDIYMCKRIQAEAGVNLYTCQDFERVEVIGKLNSGLLDREFEKYLKPNPLDHMLPDDRKRKIILLGMMALRLGVTMHPQILLTMRLILRTLPNIAQQLQVLTALDEYKDGEPYSVGSAIGMG